MPADRGHLGNPVNRHQAVPHIPVLHTPQLIEIPTTCHGAGFITPFQGVPEHLPKTGRIRPQCRSHTTGQGPSRQAVQLFENPRSGPVEIDVVLKNHIHRRQPKHRRTANGLHAGHPEQGRRQRIGHLILNILRRTPHPFGKHNLLVLTNIRDRINRDRVRRQNPATPIEGANLHAP